VAEAFAEEQPRLLPLPAHPFETDLLLSVSSRKTIYVRFDRNDYSIPPDAVGKSLTLAVSDTQLRIFEGTALRVTHRRSYDQGRRIEDPSHQEALLALKRKARGGVASARLLSVAPESEAFLDAAFLKGEHIGSLVQKLTRLLDDYGDRRFKAALAEALERGTPRASSVAYLLERRRRSERSRTPLPVDLSRRPDLADLVVRPHEGGTYDQLSRRRSDDPEE
jgi:hypothetical protein